MKGSVFLVLRVVLGDVKAEFIKKGGSLWGHFGFRCSCMEQPCRPSYGCFSMFGCFCGPRIFWKGKGWMGESPSSMAQISFRKPLLQRRMKSCTVQNLRLRNSYRGRPSQTPFSKTLYGTIGSSKCPHVTYWWKKSRQPPGMVLKPCTYWDKLPFPQLVSLPDFCTISSI